MSSNLVPFFANPVFCYCKSELIGQIKKIGDHRARMFVNLRRFIDNLYAVNKDNKVFENSF